MGAAAGATQVKRTPLRSKVPKDRFATRTQKMVAYKRDDGLCHWCGRELEAFEADHLIPHSAGGPTTDDNLVAACFRCNQQKGTMSEAEFREWLGTVAAAGALERGGDALQGGPENG